MDKISLGFVASATKGSIGRVCFNTKFTEISTDTRNISPGCLFIALKGERFDGNEFLHTAFQKGAAACLAERSSDEGTVIRVPDTGAALLSLAGAYRRRYAIPVIGVTGSVGKTSTKEMIYAVLSQKYKTHKNEGNRNNEIGMPLSAFGLDRSFGAAVFEMGMSGFGEISRLSRCAAPKIAVITNIGVSHMEKLGSQENILKAKLEILDGLQEGGVLIVNGDDPLLSKVSRSDLRIQTYGIENRECAVFADRVRTDGLETLFDLHYEGEIYPARLPVCGRHNVYNALAAFLCGLELQITPQEAVAGFLNYTPSGFRQKIEKIGGVTLIEDCYNASPDSMKSAFEVLDTVGAGGRKIAVLADMLELGALSRTAHLGVGELAASHADRLFAFGTQAEYYCEAFSSRRGSREDCLHFGDREKLAQALLGELREGDTVLFKGSRGMKLEEPIERIIEERKRR